MILNKSALSGHVIGEVSLIKYDLDICLDHMENVDIYGIIKFGNYTINPNRTDSFPKELTIEECLSVIQAVCDNLRLNFSSYFDN